jgi:hypothetical protein
MSTNVGLRQQILVAATADDIDNLLATGKKFVYASENTRRRWSVAKNRRLREMKGLSPVVAVEADSVDEVSSPKKKSKKKQKK